MKDSGYAQKRLFSVSTPDDGVLLVLRILANALISSEYLRFSSFSASPSLEQHMDKLKSLFCQSAVNYALGFQKKGKLPSNEEMVIYSTLIKGYEGAYNGINEEVLSDIPKYKDVEELIQQEVRE